MPSELDKECEADSRNQSLHMTIQFALSPALAEGEEQQTITHPRVSVLPRSSPPTTLNSLLPPDVLAKQPILALPYYYPRSRDVPDPTPPSRATKYFTPLDGNLPVDQALNGTAFVEFPTVRVFDRTEWLGKLGNGEVAVIPRFETKVAAEEKKSVPAKRERPEELGLGLGGYGSSDEDDAEEGEEADGGPEEAETKDITLSPRMAQALGQALEADFGPIGN